MVVALGVAALEEEPLDLVGGVHDDALLGVEGLGDVAQPRPKSEA